MSDCSNRQLQPRTTSKRKRETRGNRKRNVVYPEGLFELLGVGNLGQIVTVAKQE